MTLLRSAAFRRTLAFSILLFGLMSIAPSAYAQQIVGVSSIVSLNGVAISTYSATELDYIADAYYDAYVEGYLYENGVLHGSGSASSGSASNLAFGYMNLSAVSGASYQLESDHYLMAAFAYSDGNGTSFFSNPYGFAFAPGGSPSAPSGTPFNPGGGPAYVTVQYGYLGTTAVGISNDVNWLVQQTGLSDVVHSASVNPDGSYNIEMSRDNYDDLINTYQRFEDTCGCQAAGDALKLALMDVWVRIMLADYTLMQNLGIINMNRTPAKGTPNTDVTFPAPNGGKTIRRYGADGRAGKDIDYGHDHGSGDPHTHDWDWTKQPPRQPGRVVQPGDIP